MFKTGQRKKTQNLLTLKPFVRLFSEKEAEEMTSKDPLEARAQRCFSLQP